MFESLHCGITGRYLQTGKMALKIFNPHNFSTHKQRKVDHRPYGGGAGMIMSCQPMDYAIEKAKDWLDCDSNSDFHSTEEQDIKPLVIYLSPQGKLFNQTILKEIIIPATKLVLIAGRYEGIDERLLQLHVDIELSIGDVVLSGGELPAMVIIDALIRQLPGALGNAHSAAGDSLADEQLLKYPQYTRPETYKGLAVPEVLLSGNHQRIHQWRQQKMMEQTQRKRPDLIASPHTTSPPIS